MSVTPISKILDWSQLLGKEKQQPYFKQLLATIQQQRTQGITIYPPAQQIFSAFKLTAWQDLKVVIIGQDPYHGPQQAHGLAFSVRKGIRIPPSLRNIFLELHNDLQINTPTHGCLESWARQGVLLLNTSLSVQAGNPGSHSQLGWQTFTNHVIKQINAQQKHTVFMLWGAHAQRAQALIDPAQHSILCASHPSPFSAHRGFLGCKHFSTCNRLLQENGREPINWEL